MRDDHIIKMLEEKAASQLDAREIALIESHVATCAHCLQAYRAARIADSLIHNRASETIDVSPFFATRVMAAIREGHLSTDLPAIIKAWRAARAVLSAMAAVLIVLIGLTIFAGNTEQAQLPEMTASQSLLYPEFVVLEEDNAADNLLYDQVLGIVYDPEEGDGY
jgi:hypothetical protein